MLKEMLVLIVLFTAVPVGFLLAWLAKEELKAGKRWFKVMVFGSIAGLITSFFLMQYVLALTFAYIALIAGISLIKAK